MKHKYILIPVIFLISCNNNSNKTENNISQKDKTIINNTIEEQIEDLSSKVNYIDISDFAIGELSRKREKISYNIEGFYFHISDYVTDDQNNTLSFISFISDNFDKEKNLHIALERIERYFKRNRYIEQQNLQQENSNQSSPSILEDIWFKVCLDNTNEDLNVIHPKDIPKKEIILDKYYIKNNVKLRIISEKTYSIEYNRERTNDALFDLENRYITGYSEIKNIIIKFEDVNSNSDYMLY